MTPEERATKIRTELLEYFESCRPSNYAPWREWDLVGIDRTIAAAIREAVEADRKLQMTAGEESEPGINVEAFERIVAQACEPGATVERRAGKLLAAWRSWFGCGGPGLFSRLSMAKDVERVINAAVAAERERCAKIAESYEQGFIDPQHIAARIREQGK